MNNEIVFRVLLALFGIFMMMIRIYYQKKVLPESKNTTIKGNPINLIPGAIAALTSIIFSLEYIIAPGTFRFAYLFAYPYWLRFLGMTLLVVGIILLGSSHHHLDRSFSSFVAMKEEQSFIDSGPYRYIRHPIYTAYFMNYIGGGLLASNVVLTIIPIIFFALMIALRIGEEETMLVEEFGDEYRAYMKKTGRFLPFFR